MSSQHPTAVLRPAPLRNHRRESSISTSASSSSSHTRVLACAPATRPRFAVVAARRVGAGTRAVGRPPLSLAALLPPTARARPIIGLGVTLNPADAVVRLQPRHATQPLGSLPSRPPPVPRSVSCSRAACEPPPPSPDPRFADPLPVPLLPPSAAKPRRVPAAPAQWLEPPAALSPAEPAPADPPLPPQPTEPPPAKTLERPAPPARATAEVTCLLCFERVLVARRRGHALRCPSCLNALNLRGAGFVLMARGLLHALGELCTGRSRPAAADSDDGLLRRMARSSIHIMQPLHARRDDGTTRPAPTPRRSTECPRSHSRRLRSPARRLLHRSRRHTTTAPSLSPVPPQPTTTPIKSQHHRLPITRPIPGKSCSSAGSSIHRTRKRGTTAASPTARRSLLVPHMPSIPSQLPLPVALELPAAAPLIPPLHSASAMPFPTTMSPLPLPPPPPQISSAHSSGTYTNADVVHSLSAERCSPESARTLSAGTPAGNACCDIPAAMPERCATHPGSRNDLWCASCDAAVCRHCVAAASGAHSAHAVVTLAAAYDDTFEAVDSLQLQLVRHLAETRQRNAELDAAAMALAEDCAAAHAAADEQLARDAARIEVARARADADLSRQAADCAAWRAGLEAALGDVQRMVDELPPLQAVAQRARMVQMLTAAARARPPAWAAESAEPPERLVALVEPAWVHSELHVPAVAELGRRRGHVRVAGERFTAHGAVWQAEARRSRNRLGEPSLAVSVRCVEGGGCAYAVTAGIDALALAVAHSGAWARDASHDFALCLLDDLVPALAADGAVAVRIGVRAEDFQGLALAQAARIAQLEERVRVLELDASQTRGTPGGGSCSRRRSEARGWATSPRAPPVPQIPLPAPPPMQLPATQSSAHRRAASLTAAKLRRQPPIPFPIGASHSTQPSSTAADSALTSTSPTGSRIKSTFFSTSPPGSVCSRDSASAASASAAPGVLRRLSGWVRNTEGRFAQQARRVRQQLAAPAQHSETADDVSGSGLGDWTFLDGSALSPGFERLSGSADPLIPPARGGKRPLWPMRGLINVSPPRVPLPALPLESSAHHSLTEEDIAEGFAFDGMADIEREQERADARAERRRQQKLDQRQLDQPDIGAMQDKYSSIVQRFEALQLITNTYENSRDGFTEGTLRRISSELGVLMDGRRRRLDAVSSVASRDSPMRRAPRSPSPDASDASDREPRRTGATCDLGLSAQPPNCRSPRRAVTMDANDLCRAVARSDAAEPLHAPFEPLHAPSRPRPRRDSSVPPSRRMSITSVSSSASSSAGGRLSGRITRPGGATARRGSGAGSGSEAAAAPLLPMLGLSPARGPSSQQQQQQQLTPRANRQGGILKAGRTMRAKPTRLHPLAELPLTAASAVSERVLSTPGSPVLALIPDVSDDEFVFSSSGGGTSAALGAPVPRAGGRPVRTPRKSVRFPEEQRLLETIRLIDPRAAQTIESRAARPASVYLRPPPPAPLLRHQYDDVSGDEDAPLSGLAARIRYSPRLAPRSAPLAAPTSPDLFGADAALVLDDIAEHNLDADDISLAAPLFNTRPPLPPTQQQLRASSRVDNEYNECGKAQGRTSDTSLLLDSPTALQLPARLLRAPGTRRSIGGEARGALHVGPNVSSAQSSPLSLAPAGRGPAAGSVSSLSSSSEGLAPGAQDSGHLYSIELAAFGAAQIPTIACGRDTAFRGSAGGPELASDLRRLRVQGPDYKPSSSGLC
ncbi:hypothetical protein GGI04_000193 [Coemansia thaxteri]|nr:hypothetical protein GGI04_000193 [Coemansia thaxteri]